MSRTEFFQLRLTKDEKAWLARKAEAKEMKMAKLIRQSVGLEGLPQNEGMAERMIQRLKQQGLTP